MPSRERDLGEKWSLSSEQIRWRRARIGSGFPLIGLSGGNPFRHAFQIVDVCVLMSGFARMAFAGQFVGDVVGLHQHFAEGLA